MLLEDGTYQNTQIGYKMFSPNGTYGRLTVERHAVFDANLNRISGVKYIRGGPATQASADGSKNVLETMTGETFLKQYGGLFMFFDINSQPPDTDHNSFGSWNMATLRSKDMIDVGSVDDRKTVYQLQVTTEL